MRPRLLVLLICLGASSLLYAQNQAQLTDESSKRLRKAETELTSVYNKILTTYSDDKEFVKNVKESQELWTKFRTAEVKMMFPEREPGYYGSSYQMCVNDYLTNLTRERIKRLQTWLNEAVEGDVCSGSVKAKN